MKILDKLLSETGLTRYKLTEELRNRGVKITAASIYNWSDETLSMRLDVMVALADLVKEKTGKDQFMDWLRKLR